MGVSTTDHITREEALGAWVRFGQKTLAAKHFGISEAAFRRLVARLKISNDEFIASKNAVRLKSGEVLEAQNCDGTITVEAGYRNIDEALAGQKVDLDRYVVVDGSIRPNSWPSPAAGGGIVLNNQIKYQLKEREPWDAEAMAKRFEERIARLSKRQKVVKLRHKAKPESGLLLEINCPDFHFNQRTHEEETGAEWNLEIAEGVWLGMVRAAVQEARMHKPSRIILRLGDDFYDVDNMRSETTNGTRQDTAASVHRMVSRGEDLWVHTVEQLSQEAPVEATVIPGNHSMLNELASGRVLHHHFLKDRNVIVDYGPGPEKFYRHGCCTVMMVHGKTVGRALSSSVLAGSFLPAANRVGLALGPSDTCKIVRSAHVHHEKAEEINGIRVTSLSTLTATDSWHHHSMYRGSTRAAEFYTLHAEFGEYTRRTVSLAQIQARFAA